MPVPKRQQPIYLAQTQPGFEAIALEEIAARVDGAIPRGTRMVADKNGMALFEYGGDPRELMELRTIEDLFVVVSTLREPPPTFAALRLLRDDAATTSLDRALQVARQIAPARGGRGKLRFRVVARQVGRTAYRRVDAQQAVERGIAARSDHKWSLAEEGALEFWLTLLPNETILALRLSDERMRHRDYQLEHMPASLRPASAAALAWLTRPSDNDVFLDPMCGAGTILIERAHMGRYAQLLGGDIREGALAIARGNVGPRYKPIELRQWDARNLPIDAMSITAAAVNLPFGKQLGSTEENRRLYPQVLRELVRVLRPGARLALLSGDRRPLEQALQRLDRLQRRAIYPVHILGQMAGVYLVQRV